MKTILAYGDSLTWGSDPATAGRHAPHHRWPDVLHRALGADVHVVSDGLRGRTTAYDDHLADCDRNGARLLPTSLYTHAPIDLVILMLGVNDLKPHTAGSAIAAMQGMRRLIQIVRMHRQGFDDGYTAQVLVVAQPPLVETSDAEFATVFAGAPAQARKIATLYQTLTTDMGCAFFDAGTVAQASPVDGVHLDADNTKAIGLALAPQVRALLGMDS